jgi:hypothetical protein
MTIRPFRSPSMRHSATPQHMLRATAALTVALGVFGAAVMAPATKASSVPVVSADVKIQAMKALLLCVPIDSEQNEVVEHVGHVAVVQRQARHQHWPMPRASRSCSEAHLSRGCTMQPLVSIGYRRSQ